MFAEERKLQLRGWHNETDCECNRVGGHHDSDACVGEARPAGKQLSRRDGDLLRQHRRATRRYDYKGSERYDRRLGSDWRRWRQGNRPRCGLESHAERPTKYLVAPDQVLTEQDYRRTSSSRRAVWYFADLSASVRPDGAANGKPLVPCRAPPTAEPLPRGPALL